MEVTRIDQLQPGDHVSFNRTYYINYTHHAIIVKVDYKGGDVTLIEYTVNPDESKRGASSAPSKGEVCRTTIKFQDEKFKKVAHETSLPVEEVIERAESRVGEKKYNLVFNNCEHFANWCKEGDHRSEQVQAAAIPVVAAAAGVGPLGQAAAVPLGPLGAGMAGMAAINALKK